MTKLADMTAPQKAELKAAVNSVGGVASDELVGSAAAQVEGLAVPTRRAVICNGGQGSSPAQTMSRLGVRRILKLPVNTTRYRVWLRNYNAKTSATGSALTLNGMAWGVHAPGSLGSDTGNFANGAAIPLPGAGATIPGDGTWWKGDWITDPALQFAANTEHVHAVDFSAPSSMAIPSGTGQNFQFISTPANALSGAATGGNVAIAFPLDIVIEYEAKTRRKVALIVGDSNGEGYGGDASRYSKWSDAWPSLWAASGNMLAVNISQATMTAFDWSDPALTAPKWSRLPIADYAPDLAVVALGANDAAAIADGSIVSNNVGAFQSKIQTIVRDRIRPLIGFDKPIFLSTVGARDLTAASNGADKEATRKGYNDWLATIPLGADGVMDFAKAVADPTDPTKKAAQYLFQPGSDPTHLNRAGSDLYRVAANSVYRAPA